MIGITCLIAVCERKVAQLPVLRPPTVILMTRYDPVWAGRKVTVVLYNRLLHIAIKGTKYIVD